MSPAVRAGISPRRWRVVVTAGLLLFLCACSLSLTGKEERLAQLQQHLAAGQSSWKLRDYAAARSAYSAAYLLSPDDAALALRLGTVHEHLGSYREAAGLYRQALKKKDLAAELKHDLIYRLALLEAFRLEGAGQVPALLAALPPDSAYAADLHAVLALLAGDGRKALLALNQARTLPVPQELSSIILYHAARAYALTGDVDRALQSLYEGINRAGYSPVTRDITEFRDLLHKTPQP